MKKIILLALLVRILIMPFFYHPDIKSQHYHFQFFSRGVFNIYNYLSVNKKDLGYKDTFNYLPLTYYTFGFTQTVSKPLLGTSFFNWLNDWGENRNDHVDMYYYMFVLKLPYLFLDFAIAFLLFHIYKNKKLLLLWSFNPVSIYLIYVLGNFDVLPAFLTLLSFYYFKKDQLLFSYLIIGIAIALKVYPLIFLPFIFFYNKKDFIRNLKYCFFAALPLLITVAPFIYQPLFISSFLGSGLTQKILEFKLLNIPVFPFLYLLILAAYYYSKSKYRFEIAVTQMFFIFVGLVAFHPQWIMWFFPFLVVIFTRASLKGKLFLILYFLLIFSYIFLFDDNFLFWGHLTPIDSAFTDLTSPYQLFKLRTSYDPVYLQKNIHNLLMMIGIIASIKYAKDN